MNHIFCCKISSSIPPATAVYWKKTDRQTDRQTYVVLLHPYIHTDRQTEISYEDFLADLGRTKHTHVVLLHAYIHTYTQTDRDQLQGLLS